METDGQTEKKKIYQSTKYLIVNLCTKAKKRREQTLVSISSSPLPGVTGIYGFNTMWLCGAKVFQHNFITFQQLRAIVPPDEVVPGPGLCEQAEPGQKSVISVSLIFPCATQAASFCAGLWHSWRTKAPLIYFVCLCVLWDMWSVDWLTPLTLFANKQDKGADYPTSLNSSWIPC